MKKVLIIAAHPDDDILGCGGLISKYKNEIDFRVIFIAEGSSCRFDKENLKSEQTLQIIKERNEYGIKALELLGVKDYAFFDLPCGRLDQVPIIEINKIIEKEIESFKPDTVFTHSFEDTNNDHIIVHRATQMATRPGSNSFVEKVYTYEVLSSSEWRFTHTFSPNYFEALSEEDVRFKWLALAEYETEIKEFPYPRSEDGIFALAKYRGLQSANAYAEAFKLIRQIIK
ncbi:PIG-L deacetylase family protein [Flavivirga rizhaonensis]|uniref:PIG-L family deacetylase n=1 Tax=Flavivirga rizhaonensis TaxID=2559571 RepID=A0A4S1DZY1_9FLAO|nr:PIG-L family deacetylase [Flavivirga rizhaonensis]TGV03846.1 PIG-L family deacetylase [Flavivirga rizhaonensis]